MEISPNLLEEDELIESLTPEQIRTFLSLRSFNLQKQTSAITGIRAEDAVFLLQCIQMGHIPIGTSEVMSKIVDGKPPRYFVAANPEYKRTDAAQETLWQGIHHADSFKRLTWVIMRTYGSIGKKMAVHRGIWKQIAIHKKLLFDSIGKYDDLLKRIGPPEENEEEYMENLFSSFGKTIEEWEKGGQIFLQRHQSLSALKSVLGAQEMKDVQEQLYAVRNRGGVLLAFNEKLLQHDPSSKDVHDSNELSFSSANGNIPIDTILGFEPMGTWEDGLCDMLEKKIRS